MSNLVCCNRWLKIYRGTRTCAHTAKDLGVHGCGKRKTPGKKTAKKKETFVKVCIKSKNRCTTFLHAKQKSSFMLCRTSWRWFLSSHPLAFGLPWNTSSTASSFSLNRQAPQFHITWIAWRKQGPLAAVFLQLTSSNRSPRKQLCGGLPCCLRDLQRAVFAGSKLPACTRISDVNNH